MLTHADVVLTHADAASTAADAASTAADAVSTAADAVSTAADVVSAAASQAAAELNASVVAGTEWTFEASTTMAAPATGGLRFNNATVASATAIAVNAQDAEGGNPDISDFIATWDDSTNTVKGYILARKFGTPGTFAVFSVSSVTDNTTWLQIGVSYITGAGTWSAADTISLQFSRSGDKGAGLTDVVDDTTPQLGGDLDLNGHVITGLEIGTNVQAYDADLDAVAALSTAAYGLSLLELASEAAFKAAVNLEIGTDVLAYDSALHSNLPQNSKSAAYTTVLSDANGHIYHPDADTTARTWTIDSNANVAYPIGTTLTFVNGHGAGDITIAITDDTMRWASDGATGSRTLAADGMATAIKVGTTEWKISGTGLT